jgi:nitroimidazol reductase NimA-like FMN-containing flavoprotein (pyridoxamine 5'-phosphate oxidase superfamily)
MSGTTQDAQESQDTQDAIQEETPAQPRGTRKSPPPTAGAYARTDRTVPTRSADRASYDKESVHAILDEGYVCHLGFVRDGAPVVLPTLYARLGERLYVHGSTGSRPLLMSGRADPGLPVCLTVTHVDALILARSAFHHSINYRSVVVHGIAHQVTDPDEKRLALDVLVDNVVAGRSADSRPANAKELAATAVIRIDLGEVSAKMRTGGVNDEPEDLSLPHWAGVVPLRKGYETPVPDAELAPGTQLPDYLRAR